MEEPKTEIDVEAPDSIESLVERLACSRESMASALADLTEVQHELMDAATAIQSSLLSLLSSRLSSCAATLMVALGEFTDAQLSAEMLIMEGAGDAEPEPV